MTSAGSPIELRQSPRIQRVCGSSEQMLGGFSRSNRDKMMLATKYSTPADWNGVGAQHERMRRQPSDQAARVRRTSDSGSPTWEMPISAATCAIGRVWLRWMSRLRSSGVSGAFLSVTRPWLRVSEVQ